MRLELLVKDIDFEKTNALYKQNKKDKEEDEFGYADEILGKVKKDDDLEEVELAFAYRPYVLDLHNLGNYGKYDEEHTKLIFPEEGVFYAKVPYDHFNIIYSAMTGINIKTIEDFQIIKKRK